MQLSVTLLISYLYLSSTPSMTVEEMDKDLLILYGSQTGQGEAIADQIYAKCIDMGLSPRLCEMKEVDKEVRCWEGICGKSW